jgi:hypothetical protein
MASRSWNASVYGDGFLPGHRIEHKRDVRRLGRLADGGELFHQRPDQEVDVRLKQREADFWHHAADRVLVELAAAADVVKRGRETV